MAQDQQDAVKPGFCCHDYKHENAPVPGGLPASLDTAWPQSHAQVCEPTGCPSDVCALLTPTASSQTLQMFFLAMSKSTEGDPVLTPLGPSQAQACRNMFLPMIGLCTALHCLAYLVQKVSPSDGVVLSSVTYCEGHPLMAE